MISPDDTKAAQAKAEQYLRIVQEKVAAPKSKSEINSRPLESCAPAALQPCVVMLLPADRPRWRTQLASSGRQPVGESHGQAN
jgi:hypothetical protein